MESAWIFHAWKVGEHWRPHNSSHGTGCMVYVCMGRKSKDRHLKRIYLNVLYVQCAALVRCVLCAGAAELFHLNLFLSITFGFDRISRNNMHIWFWNTNEPANTLLCSKAKPYTVSIRYTCMERGSAHCEMKNGIRKRNYPALKDFKIELKLYWLIPVILFPSTVPHTAPANAEMYSQMLKLPMPNTRPTNMFQRTNLSANVEYYTNRQTR